MEKPEGKSPLGRPRGRWEDNIKMTLKEVGYGVMEWIDPAQDRDRWRALVNAVINFIFGRANDLYLCLYNQLFALFYYVFLVFNTLKL